MAVVNEIRSLEDIHYPSKIKIYLYPLIISFMFVIAFLNYYPVGQQLKIFMKKNLQGKVCNPDWQELRWEWLFPKLIISDLKLPAGCLGRTGEDLRFTYVNINLNLISFAPFGFPFKIETEINGQPLSVYLVQGFGKRQIRIKDQPISLNRLEPLLGSDFKLSGNMVIDMNVISGKNGLEELTFKTRSKDFQLPSQNIQGFTTPNVRLNDFYIEANSYNSSKITINKFIIGDPDSPIRANLTGHFTPQEGNIQMSPLNLKGEMAFTQSFKEAVPLVDLFFQSYTQKDGFYQIRIGGTLGQPKLMNP
jgi:hypothetical protein